MEYTFLGNTGLEVSRLCLGTITFGQADDEDFPLSFFFKSPRQINESTSHQILDRYVELGGNFLDTADCYSKGMSETIIGNWMGSRQNREDITVATKCYMPLSFKSKLRCGLSRRNIVAACEESLQRLKTNYIDLYQCHVWDNATPIDETLRTLDDLVRCGKIRYYGFSNVCGWQMQKIVDTAKEFKFTRCASLQQEYSLLERNSEYEAFMPCKAEGISVLPWGPLKGGLLTGKFERGTIPHTTESRVGFLHGSKAPNTVWEQFSDSDKYWQLIDMMKNMAIKHDKTVPQIAIRWLMQKDCVASVIVGVTSMAQLEDNMAVCDGWRLSKEEIKQLDEASAVTSVYPYQLIYGPMIVNRYNHFNPASLNKSVQGKD